MDGWTAARLGCLLCGGILNRYSLALESSVLGVFGTNWSSLLHFYLVLYSRIDEPESYRRRLRLFISHGMPSTEQFAQGRPDNVTIHLTFRKLQALHAMVARFKVWVEYH